MAFNPDGTEHYPLNTELDVARYLAAYWGAGEATARIYTASTSPRCAPGSVLVEVVFHNLSREEAGYQAGMLRNHLQRHPNRAAGIMFEVESSSGVDSEKHFHACEWCGVTWYDECTNPTNKVCQRECLGKLPELRAERERKEAIVRVAANMNIPSPKLYNDEFAERMAHRRRTKNEP